MTALVLGFSGRVASGKSSLSAAIAEELGVPRISFGGYVRSVAQYLGLDAESRSVLQDVGNLLVNYPAPFCTKVLEQTGYLAGMPIVIDGIRHEEIADELRRQIVPAAFALIYVSADEATIQRRLQQRGNMDFLTGHLEDDPTEMQVRTTLPNLADLVIDNGSDRLLKDACDEVLRWVHGRSAVTL